MNLGQVKRYIPLLLRVPLGFLFLFFGIDKLLAPQATAAIIQLSILSSLIPAGNLIIYSMGSIEILVSILLITGIQPRKAGALAALLLVPIILIAQIPQDIVLFFLALAISILGKDNPWKRSPTRSR